MSYNHYEDDYSNNYENYEEVKVHNKEGNVNMFVKGTLTKGWEKHLLVANDKKLSYGKVKAHMKDIQWNSIVEVLHRADKSVHPAAENPHDYYFGVKYRNNGENSILLFKADNSAEHQNWIVVLSSHVTVDEGSDEDDEYEMVHRESKSTLATAIPIPLSHRKKRAATNKGSKLRQVVSKKKLRFQQDGFDLDLAYINQNIIAMGFPSSGTEAYYRNPYSEVLRFFDTYHPNNYMVYNLCAERVYDTSFFHGRFEHFPFDDHNPPPLSLMMPFLISAGQFINASPSHIVAVHCKAGKGRTGTFIASLLLYLHWSFTAEDALTAFGNTRTHDGKGVTIPSQKRYVKYCEQILGPLGGVEPPDHVIYITKIELNTTPHFDRDGGCDPYFTIHVRDVNNKPTILQVHTSKTGKIRVKHYNKLKVVPMEVPNIKVRGDVKVCFFDHDPISSDEPMFHFWFHTGFLTDDMRITLKKSELDGACKDKQNVNFDTEFSVTVHYQWG